MYTQTLERLNNLKTHLDEMEEERIATLKAVSENLDKVSESFNGLEESMNQAIKKATTFNVELMKISERQSLVARIVDGKVYEYVVCSFFNPERPIGSQWDWGHYFSKLESAMEYAMECQDRIPRRRLEELATLFKDGLICDGEDAAMEYFTDICDMTEDEMEFFHIGVEEEDDDADEEEEE